MFMLKLRYDRPEVKDVSSKNATALFQDLHGLKNITYLQTCCSCIGCETGDLRQQAVLIGDW
jgi:hypothetical protein